MDKEGPKEWAKLRLLQACERLNIPEKLWPTFQGGLRLPAHYGFEYLTKDTLPISAFHPLYESEAEWRQRARDELEKILESNALVFRVWFKREMAEGRLTRIRPTRDTTPVELRYEWAARRHCLRIPYKELASDKYAEARIKRAVLQILRDTGLKKVI